MLTMFPVVNIGWMHAQLTGVETTGPPEVFLSRLAKLLPGQFCVRPKGVGFHLRHPFLQSYGSRASQSRTSLDDSAPKPVLTL